MTSSIQKLAAVLLVVFSLVSSLKAQSEPSGTAPASASELTTTSLAAPEAPAAEDAHARENTQNLEKRLDQLITHQEGTNQILRAMAEGMAAKQPAPTVEAAVEPAPTSQATTEAIQAVQDNVTYTWIIFGGALVFIMQAGFAMLELGVSRAKNSINVLMKNYLDFCIGSIVYLLVGFSLQFGDSWRGIIGWEAVWLPNFSADHKLWIFFFFQVGFASAGCTIVSGAMAERTKYVGYLVYSGIFVLLIYPMCAHWAWGSAGGAWGMSGTKGWLESLGFVDFAGSSVVHACGGACALAGIMIVGPRVGRFAKDGTPRLIAGHNIPLATLGAMLLLFGWFGFNAGSTLNANVSIGRVAVNTLLAPCSGALFAMLAMWFAQGKSDIGIAINGSLGGAVGITACCANVTPASALVIGAVAGLLTSGATILLERFRLDDVAGAIPVHLVNGWWGTLSVALFDEKGFDIGRLGVQALGTLSISVTSFVGGWAIFKVVDMTVGLRTTELEQEHGLDFSEHAVNAYPDFQTSERA